MTHLLLRPPGTFTPRPGPGSPARMLAAQAGTELRLALRQRRAGAAHADHPGGPAGGPYAARRRPAARAAGRGRDAVGARAGRAVDGVHQPGDRAGLRPPVRGDPPAGRDGAAALAARRGPARGGARRGRGADGRARRAGRCARLAAAGRGRGAGRCRWSCSGAPRSARWASCSAGRCVRRWCWPWRTPCGSCCCSPAASSCPVDAAARPAGGGGGAAAVGGAGRGAARDARHGRAPGAGPVLVLLAWTAAAAVLAVRTCRLRST